MKLHIITCIAILLLLLVVNAPAQTPGTIKWSFPTGGSLVTPLAIDNSGIVFACASDGKLYAINADGSTKWDFNVAGESMFMASIGSEGSIYVLSDKKLYALTNSGAQKWAYSASSPPAIGGNDRLYFVTDGKKLKSAELNGTINWTHTFSDSVFFVPALGPDGTIYVTTFDLYAINPDGNEKWHYSATKTGMEFISSSPVIASDGTVYINVLSFTESFDMQTRLYAIDGSGKEKWTYKVGNFFCSLPVLGIDGTIYINSDDSNIYAVNPDGSLKWKKKKPGSSIQIYDLPVSPSIGSNGSLVFGYNGNCYSFSSTGDVEWTYKTNQSDYVTDASILHDGTIYFGCGKNVFAVHSNSGGLAESAWPKIFGGNQNMQRPDDPAAIFENDIGVAAVHLPADITVGSAVTISALVKNYGSISQSNLQVSYQINSDNPVVENFSVSVPSLETAEINFSIPWVPSAVGNYTVTVRTNLIGDEKPENDAQSTAVVALYDKDVGITGIEIPAYTAIHAPVKIKVNVKNFGSEPQSNFAIKYQVSDGTSVTETCSQSIAKNQTASVIFSAPWAPGSLGDYQVTAATQLSGDQNTANDKASASISVVNARYLGAWEGQTSQNRSFYFHVNGNDEIDSIAIEIRVDFGGAQCTYVFGNSSLISIENDTFKVEVFGGIAVPAGENNPIVHGTFKSPELCDGSISKFRAAGGMCGNQVIFGTGYTNAAKTWSANRDMQTIAVEMKKADRPDEIRLLQNYPNPFNPQTTIEYKILNTTWVSLKIFDINGREMMTLVDGEQAQGSYQVIFENRHLPSGVYFYRLMTDTDIQYKKMTIVK
ncbi:PQQ-binding-like beta-propeller repeat protein [candidate division KSB1 bacterium]|nr:PQQ-binding-like beta-propeller repeat protein [candidate division KSB1 bacterium]